MNQGAEPTGSARAEADAAARGLEIRIVERSNAGSLQQAADMLGISPSDIVKTLVVKRSDGTFLFALIPGGRKISWPKLRAVVGANKLAMPDQTVAYAATGYERGAITPLGSSTAWPVFADESIGIREIAMGSGDHAHSLFVDSASLLTSLGATVADISEAEA
jgi:Cys-tRNA(Pro)/Cys-tRNA(Cys) deacylase